MRMTDDMLAPSTTFERFPGRVMRSVTVWACFCGVLYKAICEIDRKSSPVKQASVICSHCQAVMKLDGVVSSCQEQIAEGQWRTVGAN
jgi:hypothetical protein